MNKVNKKQNGYKVDILACTLAREKTCQEKPVTELVI